MAAPLEGSGSALAACERRRWSTLIEWLVIAWIVVVHGAFLGRHFDLIRLLVSRLGMAAR